MTKQRIAILGGGFAGVYTAMYLEKYCKHLEDVEVALISRDNYFTYQPMLSEVVGGSLGVYDTVSSLRSLLPKTTLYIREVSEIHAIEKEIHLSPNFNHKNLCLTYDHLVIALGNVTDFRNSPAGLHEHALPFKNLSNALSLRNHLIDVVETAANEQDPELKKQLLTFIVGGGGFSGVEAVAEINDFVRSLSKKMCHIRDDEIRVMLVHRNDRLMHRELSTSLSRYAEKILSKRGVEVCFNDQLLSATPMEAILEKAGRIPSSTIVSTVPASSNPLIETLPFECIGGRIQTDPTLQVVGSDSVWAVGDCAAIPLLGMEGHCPPTAQFAIREAKTLAKNLIATLSGKKKKVFKFKQVGMMAALGHHRAVGELFGCIKLSGLSAWFIWRMVYLWKLPSFRRKVKVAVTWILEILFPNEPVQLKVEQSKGISHLHFEKGETIFHQGDVGDYLYIVVEGEVEITCNEKEKNKKLGVVKEGEYFGEMALMNQKQRTATATCLTSADIVAIRKRDFHILMKNFDDLRSHFQKTKQARLELQIKKFREQDNRDDFVA